MPAQEQKKPAACLPRAWGNRNEPPPTGSGVRFDHDGDGVSDWVVGLGGARTLWRRQPGGTGSPASNDSRLKPPVNATSLWHMRHESSTIARASSGAKPEAEIASSDSSWEEAKRIALPKPIAKSVKTKVLIVGYPLKIF